MAYVSNMGRTAKSHSNKLTLVLNRSWYCSGFRDNLDQNNVSKSLIFTVPQMPRSSQFRKQSLHNSNEYKLKQNKINKNTQKTESDVSIGEPFFVVFQPLQIN